MDSEQSNFGVNFGHNVGEFFEVDKPVSVLIGEVNHLIDFSAIEVLSNTGSNFLEFFRSECSSSWAIESFENSLKGCLAVVVSSETEDVKESREIDLSDVARVVDDG